MGKALLLKLALLTTLAISGCKTSEEPETSQIKVDRYLTEYDAKRYEKLFEILSSCIGDHRDPNCVDNLRPELLVPISLIDGESAKIAKIYDIPAVKIKCNSSKKACLVSIERKRGERSRLRVAAKRGEELTALVFLPKQIEVKARIYTEGSVSIVELCSINGVAAEAFGIQVEVQRGVFKYTNSGDLLPQARKPILIQVKAPFFGGNSRTRNCNF